MYLLSDVAISTPFPCCARLILTRSLPDGDAYKVKVIIAISKKMIFLLRDGVFKLIKICLTIEVSVLRQSLEQISSKLPHIVKTIQYSTSLRGDCQLCKYQIETSYRAGFLRESSLHYSKHFDVSNF